MLQNAFVSLRCALDLRISVSAESHWSFRPSLLMSS